ncbi:hypothetical protein B0H14DRAFT_3430933 [Mycena olivaceomarginata]|nr:hypothetical protein B0H14DRAFT_3430933 [Mycena olivaceomarginata]
MRLRRSLLNSVRRYCQHFQQVQKDGAKGKLTKNETKDIAAPPVPPAGDAVQTSTTSTLPPVETSTLPPVQTSTPPPVPSTGDAVQTSTPPPVQTSTPLPVPPAGNTMQTSTLPPVETVHFLYD